jgi:hypothetical protein
MEEEMERCELKEQHESYLREKEDYETYLTSLAHEETLLNDHALNE